MFSIHHIHDSSRWDVLSDMYKEIVISNISSIDQEALGCNYEQAQCDQAIILQKHLLYAKHFVFFLRESLRACTQS